MARLTRSSVASDWKTSRLPIGSCFVGTNIILLQASTYTIGYGRLGLTIWAYWGRRAVCSWRVRKPTLWLWGPYIYARYACEETWQNLKHYHRWSVSRSFPIASCFSRDALLYFALQLLIPGPNFVAWHGGVQSVADVPHHCRHHGVSFGQMFCGVVMYNRGWWRILPR
jgi:hypothetical protein